jgi:hypothetical protein
VTRIETAEHAIRFDMPLEALRQALGELPWDCDEPLVRLSAADVVAVLDRFLAETLSADEVVGWAELLEVRDDVDFGLTVEDADAVHDTIWWLANPEINLLGGKLDRDNALVIRQGLSAWVA